MSPKQTEEFYVGYLPKAPAGQARFLRRAVLLLLIGAAALADLLVVLQEPFDRGIFEYLEYREFVGVIRARPYPMLLVQRPGEAAVEASAYHLVAYGKRGADQQVEGLDGRPVRLEGSLIYRGDQTMIELVEGSLRSTDEEHAERLRQKEGDLGLHTFTGEIVDSKCFLGVMKPGRRKPHRACATRCISGGIPPALLVETRVGESELLLLVDGKGRAVNDRILELVAETVEITGRLRRRSDRLFLAADPSTYRRIRR